MTYSTTLAWKHTAIVSAIGSALGHSPLVRQIVPSLNQGKGLQLEADRLAADRFLLDGWREASDQRDRHHQELRHESTFHPTKSPMGASKIGKYSYEIEPTIHAHRLMSTLQIPLKAEQAPLDEIFGDKFLFVIP